MSQHSQINTLTDAQRTCKCTIHAQGMHAALLLLYMKRKLKRDNDRRRETGACCYVAGAAAGKSSIT